MHGQQNKILPPSYAIVLEYGSLNLLEPSGFVQPCTGIVVPLCFKQDRVDEPELLLQAYNPMISLIDKNFQKQRMTVLS